MLTLWFYTLDFSSADIHLCNFVMIKREREIKLRSVFGEELCLRISKLFLARRSELEE